MNVKIIQSLRLQIESLKEDIFKKQIVLNCLESKLKDELMEEDLKQQLTNSEDKK